MVNETVLGRAVVVTDSRSSFLTAKKVDIVQEQHRLTQAVSAYIRQTNAAAKQTDAAAQEILSGHAAILADDVLREQFADAIAQGFSAEASVNAVLSAYEQQLAALENGYLRQRAEDIRDLRNSLLQQLSGCTEETLPSGCIAVVHTVTPSFVCRAHRSGAAAIVTHRVSPLSHAAILAEAFGLPLAATDDLCRIQNGDLLLVDGLTGTVVRHPDEATVKRYRRQSTAQIIRVEDTPINVTGSICFAKEAPSVLRNGGTGIGLFRTEFLLMDSPFLTTEEALYREYTAAVQAINGSVTVIRTFDIGGDKTVPYLLHTAKEKSPYGDRGIRYCLENKALFQRQLRAVLRSAMHGNIRLLLPMVSTVDEVNQARSLIKACFAGLQAEETPCRNIPVGVMIETPEAIGLAKELAKKSDFFSIGTNDLTGFLTAADRTNATDNHPCDVMQPAVLNAVRQMIKSAKTAHIPVSICGEAAADKRLLPHLIEWGADSLAVAPQKIPQVLQNLNHIKTGE